MGEEEDKAHRAGVEAGKVSAKIEELERRQRRDGSEIVGDSWRNYRSMGKGSGTMVINKILPIGVGAAVTAGLLQGADILLPPVIDGSAAYTAPVSPGETVLVPWSITKRSECPGEVSRVWTGSQGYLLKEKAMPTTLPMGSVAPKVQTHIPDMAPEGSLELKLQGYLQCEGKPKQHFTLGPVFFEVRGG